MSHLQEHIQKEIRQPRVKKAGDLSYKQHD